MNPSSGRGETALVGPCRTTSSRTTSTHCRWPRGAVKCGWRSKVARTTPGQNPRSHWRHLRRWAGDATSAAAGGPSAAMPTATVRQRRVAASDDRSGTPPKPWGMRKISYAGYRFPPEVIDHAIWLYLRFTLSFRDVEDLLAERGIAVSYETVRRWVNHFGPMIAAQLRKRRPKPHATWHLDEVYLKIDGRTAYLWRAVDAEGEVLDVLVQSRRNKHAALKLMRKLLKKYSFVPKRLVTDDLRSYDAAARTLGLSRLHERGRWKNNRAENSHQPTRRGGARCTFQER